MYLDRKQWTEDDIAHLGRSLFERVPGTERADWAASIALHAAKHSRFEEIERLVETSYGSDTWYKAESIFHELRKLSLNNEALDRGQSIDQRVLDVAESAAKVIANAGGAKFDYHAGWRLAPRLKVLVNQVCNQQFEDESWVLLLRGSNT